MLLRPSPALLGLYLYTSTLVRKSRHTSSLLATYPCVQGDGIYYFVSSIIYVVIPDILLLAVACIVEI